VLSEMMMTEHQSGPRRLGRSLAGTRDLILPLLGALAVPRRASPERGQNGLHRHEFAPKVVLLLIITVEEVFNCRSVHLKVTRILKKKNKKNRLKLNIILNIFPRSACSTRRLTTQ